MRRNLCCFIFFFVPLIIFSNGSSPAICDADGNEYFLPDLVFLGMEDEASSYIQSKYDKKYVAISKMKSDGNYPLMKKTYDRIYREAAQRQNLVWEDKEQDESFTDR